MPLTNNECRSNLRGLGAETGCRHGAVGGPEDSCGPCPIFHFVNGSSAAPNAAGIVEQGSVDMVNIDRQYAEFAAGFVTAMAVAHQPFLLYFASHHIHWPQFSMDDLNGSTPRGPVGDVSPAAPDLLLKPHRLTAFQKCCLLPKPLHHGRLTALQNAANRGWQPSTGLSGR